MKCPVEIVIVGGGTAGWLTALFMGLLVRSGQARVTVVASSRLPSIGVGESSTGLFTSMLLDPKFGLDVTAFFREARASLKLGIKHQDWRRPGFTYYGPIDDPAGFAPALAPGGFPLLQAQAMASDRPVADAHLNGRLMAAWRAPITSDPEEILPTFACHFDTHALAGYLARACADFSTYVDALITGIARETDGSIKALYLDDGRKINGDLFLDCSGFARILIQREMGAQWRSWGDHLPLDAAIAFVREHDPGSDLPLWTEARALDAGWLWGIPTADRMGCGYIYASSLIGADEALEEVKRTVGADIGQVQRIRFESGRLDRVWIGNCVAIGLAGSFAEPLESTSIHSTLLQLIELVGALQSSTDGLPDEALVTGYNRRFAAIFDDFRDFLALHYRTERKGELWQSMRERPLPDALTERLALWQRSLPELLHFEASSGAVSPVLYLPVLDGLGLISRDVARDSIARRGLAELAVEVWQLSDTLYGEFVDTALPHRQALSRLSDPERMQPWPSRRNEKRQRLSSTCTPSTKNFLSARVTNPS
jgi:tryptophan halogenase